MLLWYHQCSLVCNLRQSFHKEVDKNIQNKKTKNQLMIAIRVQRTIDTRIELWCEYQIYTWPRIFKNMHWFLIYLIKSRLWSNSFNASGFVINISISWFAFKFPIVTLQNGLSLVKLSKFSSKFDMKVWNSSCFWLGDLY